MLQMAVKVACTFYYEVTNFRLKLGTTPESTGVGVFCIRIDALRLRKTIECTSKELFTYTRNKI